jgi:acyl dehydratase
MNSPVHEIPDAIRYVAIGRGATYTRDIDGQLIGQYAEVSGDFHRLHIDSEYARSTPWGKRIAHGTMMMGFMSTASTILSEEIEAETGRANVSLGYDRVRFVAPVFEGDTIETRIAVSELLPERGRILCDVTCTNQNGDTVAAAVHIMRFI